MLYSCWAKNVEKGNTVNIGILEDNIAIFDICTMHYVVVFKIMDCVDCERCPGSSTVSVVVQCYAPWSR